MARANLNVHADRWRANRQQDVIKAVTPSANVGEMSVLAPQWAEFERAEQMKGGA
jgi:hypothetical protein